MHIIAPSFDRSVTNPGQVAGNGGDDSSSSSGGGEEGGADGGGSSSESNSDEVRTESRSCFTGQGLVV